MKDAKVKVVKRIETVGHPCKACEWDNPPIVCEGVIKDSGQIDWPIFAGYHIGYCPHCGDKLPRSISQVHL